MKKVRMGVIGVGGMGTNHAQCIAKGAISRCELAAVCDINETRLAQFPADTVKKYHDSKELIRSGDVDAVVIATPHYGHTTIGIDALNNGLHTLVEKPISVHRRDCERLIAAHTDKKVVFAAMFNQRTDPHFKKIKQLLDDGVVGELMRVNWIITTWFRSQSYYDNGSWRATWEGEGGGVLLNQCPHQLDLLQWLCGMPSKIHAFGRIAGRHDIEVEDEVTAYLEYPNGATGVFITSTGEAPGTNRLEIAGDRGIIVLDGQGVRFFRNEVSCIEFCKTSKEAFASPEVWNITIPVKGHGGQHQEILQNYVDAILDGTQLIAPAEEGINSVSIGNAMLQSILTKKTIDMPLNAVSYERLLKKLIRESTFNKKTVQNKAVTDLSKSFQ